MSYQNHFSQAFNLRSKYERKPTKEDVAQATIAVNMFKYVMALPYSVMSLREELTQKGLFKREIKHYIQRAEDLSIEVSSHAYKRVFGNKTLFDNKAIKLSAEYVNRGEKTWEKICDCVILDNGLEKYYNTTVAICELIKQYNSQLSDTFYYLQAEPLYKIPDWLKVCKIDKSDLSNIIKLTVK